MTLDKALETLGTYRDEGEVDLSKNLDNALTLGIEALKARKRDRVCRGNYVDNLLPGETKDYCKFCGLAHTGIECPNREGEQ